MKTLMTITLLILTANWCLAASTATEIVRVKILSKYKPKALTVSWEKKKEQ